MCRQCYGPYVGIDRTLAERSLASPNTTEARKREIERRLLAPPLKPARIHFCRSRKEYFTRMRDVPYPCHVDEFARAESFAAPPIH